LVFFEKDGESSSLYNYPPIPHYP